MAAKPFVISLYSGAGGLDYGFEAAGYRTAVCVEMDTLACKTLSENRRWRVMNEDIHNVESETILRASRCGESGPDIVIGGPPCQPFSKSSYWSTGDAGRLDDPRSSTLWQYMRVVEETQPRAFLLENVHGLSYRNKAEGLELLKAEVERINQRTGSNYRPVWAVLNAADVGVPQRRERFFMVAARDGTAFRFPNPTHGETEAQGELQFDARQPFHTAWDALADVGPDEDECVDASGYWADLLPSIPEGLNYQFHTSRGGGRPLFGWRRRYWSFLLKLAKNQPAWTIQAQPGSAIGPFHWENRRLSMRELARLQTFPDDVRVTGGRSAVQRQLGNAVPSLLAEVLARAIKVQLLGRHRMGRCKLMPPRRQDLPAAEPVRRVPRRYRKHEGEHDAHPGTGLGPAAVARSA